MSDLFNTGDPGCLHYFGILGVGIETISLMGELLGGLVQGSFFQETFIKILAYSSAPTGLTAFALILWGLRNTE